MKSSRTLLALSLGFILFSGCEPEESLVLNTQLTLKEALAECGQLDMSKVTRDDSDPRGLVFTVAGETSGENTYTVDPEEKWGGWGGQIPAISIQIEEMTRPGDLRVVWTKLTGLNPAEEPKVLKEEVLTIQTCDDGMQYASSTLDEPGGVGGFTVELYQDQRLLQILPFSLAQ